MHILLVEDNLENAKLTIRILQAVGYEVEHTISGLDGLKRAKEKPFDGILLDFDLPDIDGAQVGLTLRKRLPTTPIVALTAHADKITYRKAQLFGFDAFIPKPCTDDELINALHNLIKTKD